MSRVFDQTRIYVFFFNSIKCVDKIQKKYNVKGEIDKSDQMDYFLDKYTKNSLHSLILFYTMA